MHDKVNISSFRKMELTLSLSLSLCHKHETRREIGGNLNLKTNFFMKMFNFLPFKMFNDQKIAAKFTELTIYTTFFPPSFISASSKATSYLFDN